MTELKKNEIILVTGGHIGSGPAIKDPVFGWLYPLPGGGYSPAPVLSANGDI